jgi:hypothetical protein
MHKFSLRWFMKQSPYWLILIYFFIIPTFALAFYIQPPGSFYAPYAKFEPSARSDTKAIADAIVHHTYKSLETHPPGWLIDPSSVRVDHVDAQSVDRFAFEVRLDASRVGPRGLEMHENERLPLAITLPSRIYQMSSDDGPCRMVELLEDSTFPTYADDKKMMSELFRSPAPCANFPALSLSWREDDHLNALIAGYLGDPSYLSGWFERTLYFSATTVTTVGFGDIVPLTPRARFLCGLEPILGWLFAGLFVTAVTTRRKMRAE